MIRTILAHFGFIRIPPEAIKLMLLIEAWVAHGNSKSRNHTLLACEALLGLLRSGKLQG